MEMFKDLALIIVFAKIFGLLARNFKMPQVVGEIIAGLILGPSLLGIVNQNETISSLAEIGVILLMFSSGLGTSIKDLKKTGVQAFFIATMGVLVPLIGGTFLYMLFNHCYDIGSLEFYKALFIGCIMTATSVSITVAALKEMGYLKGKVGTTILSAAIIDDVIGILVLTFIISLRDPNTNIILVLVKNLLYFIMIFITGLIVNKVFKIIDNKHPHTRRISILSLGFCFANTYIAEHYFGVADVTGAFFSGIILSDLFDSEYIQRRMDIQSYILFSPIFFASIGLKTNLDTLNMSILGFTCLFVLVALITKIIGCFFASKVCHFNNAESLKIGVGMMTRGEVALIVAQKGLNVGLMENSVFTSVIVLIIISSIVTPIILNVLFNKFPEKKMQI